VPGNIISILNQLIDELDIPSGKLSLKTDSASDQDQLVSRGRNYTVTYRASSYMGNDYFDDEYVNQEEFERWTRMQDEKKVATLK
jgi:hypothetical protein